MSPGEEEEEEEEDGFGLILILINIAGILVLFKNKQILTET